MKSIDISEALYARLEKFTKNSKEEINEVGQRAIEWYLDQCENPQPKDVVSFREMWRR